MRYKKPQYYDQFVCTAQNCPDTCCAGWEILIDQESLDKYSQVKGAFGVRLLNSIDWYQGAFEPCNGRCSFLNEDNLCDIYKELGEEALCETCRKYPRHVEEYEGVRELSLSLSCPVAAEIILGHKGSLTFLSQEDEQEETEEDYEEFDVLLFDELEEVRELLFAAVQDTGTALKEKMALVLILSRRFQEALQEGSLFGIDWKAEEEKGRIFLEQHVFAGRYQAARHMEKDLRRLEVLREEWTKGLEKLEEQLYAEGEENYREDYRKFLQDWEAEEENWEAYGERLLMFFLYTYFCGAVYDDMVYTKGVLSVFSVFWIEELLFLKWKESGRIPGFSQVVKAAYSYAREIEHSDENLNLLEEIFEASDIYALEKLIDCIME